MEYLWHPVTLASSRVLNLVPYFGGGAGIGLWSQGNRNQPSEFRFGIVLKILAGLAIHWKKVPLDTVLEMGWSPFLFKINPAEFGAGHGDVSIKVRYFF